MHLSEFEFHGFRSIFEKRLLALLPYHILRYESFLKSNSDNPKKMDKLLGDLEEICQKLLQIQETEMYFNLVNLIKQIADYVIPKENPVRERIGEVMGGQVLMLKSEEIRQEGIAQGITQGIAQGITQGIEEGRNKEKCDTAIRMRKANMPIENIAVFINETIDDTISLLADAEFSCDS